MVFFSVGPVEIRAQGCLGRLTPLPACGSDDSLARANDAAAQSFE
jgi:hypothetical protein